MQQTSKAVAAAQSESAGNAASISPAPVAARTPLPQWHVFSPNPCGSPAPGAMFDTIAQENMLKQMLPAINPLTRG